MSSFRSAEGYGSNYSAWTGGQDFADWGAGMGAWFNQVGDRGCPYDASVYSGMSFCARGTGAASVRFTTVATTSINEGGTCPVNCYDHFSTDLALTDVWQCHQIAWTDLSQAGWGIPATFDPANLIALQVQFPVNELFELYLDDLSFWGAGT